MLRQTDRQTGGETDWYLLVRVRQVVIQTGVETHRQVLRQTDRQIGGQTESHTDRKVVRQSYRQEVLRQTGTSCSEYSGGGLLDSQVVRQSGVETDRQVVRQSDRQSGTSCSEKRYSGGGL